MMNHLIDVVTYLGRANDLHTIPVHEWPSKIDYNYHELDCQASLLSEDEIAVFTDGEQTEMEELIERYGIQELHNFLNDIFDGDLNDKFFK